MPAKIHRNSLQPGFKLHWYVIEEILGQGGFGITYLARDVNLDQHVAIKEYLPTELAVREGDHSVHPVSEERDKTFRWGLQRFITEARALSQFSHPNIVRVRNVFEDNNTAYIVMDYEQGESLQDLLTRRKTLDEQEVLRFLLPVMDGLDLVHEAGFIHRDVKPANIFIRDDGTPVLLDFGSARRSLGQATKTLTSLVSPGYAPFEQYYSKSDEQGPWTDIYGLGATLYRAAIGFAPMDALDRSKGIIQAQKDVLVSAAELGKDRYSPGFLAAVDHAVRFRIQDRPQSIGQWRSEFEGGTAPPPPAETAVGTAPAAVPAAHTVAALPLRSYTPLLSVLLVIALAVAGVLYREQVMELVAPDAAQPSGHPPPPSAAVLAARRAEREAQQQIREARQREIAETLALAAEDISAGRLISPVKNNALERYLAVLELDPENEAAKAGHNGIFDFFLDAADSAIRDKDFAAAEVELARADAVQPDTVAVRLARVKLAEARASAERAARELAEKQAAEKRRRADAERRRLAAEQRRREEEQRRREEEERRALEAARLAELERLREEQEARRLAELDKRRRFDEFLADARLAVQDRDKSRAIDSYNEALLLYPDDIDARRGLAVAKDLVDKVCSEVVGDWEISTGGIASLMQGGSVTYNFLFVHTGGTWESVDPSVRRFAIDMPGFQAMFILSEDGQRLEGGRDAMGNAMSGRRKGP